jgi:hypothetical protein
MRKKRVAISFREHVPPLSSERARNDQNSRPFVWRSNHTMATAVTLMRGSAFA